MRTIRVEECVVEPRTGWVLKLTDGWAGGCGWYRFDIMTGPYEGKFVWFCEDDYEARVWHDQYETFNSDSPLEGHPNDTPMGGCVISFLHGASFEEMGIEEDEDIMGPTRPEYSLEALTNGR